MVDRMDDANVVRLDITANVCQRHEKTWSDVVKELDSADVQVIFASTKFYLDNPLKLREELERQLRIPQMFFERMYVQSNGFAGHNACFGDNEEVKSYTFWSRFTVKQTYDELKPKRTFIPHFSNHKTKPGEWDADITVHGPQSMQHGWEWYEIGFFTYWNVSGHLTLLCFDMPARSQSVIQSMFCSQTVDTSCPYAVFALVSDELLRLYDNSVWSIRNHISQWEAMRSRETDYVLLHEIARHGVHVSETLNVAVRSLCAVLQNHDKFSAERHPLSGKSKRRSWDTVKNHFEFQLRFLEGLVERSQANNARIQNEITLAFNAAAQRDSRIQVRIGEDAQREASAMKAIAVVTMTFLPATFVSTLFGMNFFSFDSSGESGSSSFTVSRYFWVYWAFSVPMTAVTLVVWFWWNRWAKHLTLSKSKANLPFDS